jgi:nucleoid-associated protein EbfC
MRGNIGNLLKQAQAMQDKLQKAQGQVSEISVSGEAAGGQIKVSMNGRYQVSRVQIDPQLMTEDREVLEDLLVAAINDAAAKTSAAVSEKMSGAMAGMSLPPGMKLPF